MAQHVLRGPVADQMMQDLFKPEVLSAKVPGMDELQAGADYVRDMQDEIGILGKHQFTNGFTEMRTMQRLCKLNNALQLTIENIHEADCSCSRGIWGPRGHKEWFLDFLKNYIPSLDLRNKVVLG